LRERGNFAHDAPQEMHHMLRLQRFGRCLWLASAIGAALTIAETASATTISLSFYQVTNNGSSNDNVADQLRVVVSPGTGGMTSGQAIFTFFNDVGIVPYSNPSSITDIYFDDGTLLGIASITSSYGVSFSQYASPKNLPGANNVTPKFETTAGFSLDSNSPVSQNGVDKNTEWVQVTFDLLSGKTYAHTLAALAKTPGALDELRVGIKVQAINGPQSNAYVNNTPTLPVPDSGATASLLLVGLASVGLVARRKI
jgi:hypothetical protein